MSILKSIPTNINQDSLDSTHRQHQHQRQQATANFKGKN